MGDVYELSEYQSLVLTLITTLLSAGFSVIIISLLGLYKNQNVHFYKLITNFKIEQNENLKVCLFFFLQLLNFENV